MVQDLITTCPSNPKGQTMYLIDFFFLSVAAGYQVALASKLYSRLNQEAEPKASLIQLWGPASLRAKFYSMPDLIPTPSLLA